MNLQGFVCIEDSWRYPDDDYFNRCLDELAANGVEWCANFGFGRDQTTSLEIDQNEVYGLFFRNVRIRRHAVVADYVFSNSELERIFSNF